MSVIHDLMQVIQSRKFQPPSNSYTATLLAGGVGKIADKISEETAELTESSLHGTDAEVIHETADLLYHILVLLAIRDLTILDIECELQRRFGLSGLDEKSNRKT